jgi:DNA mismatch repair protein MutS
MLKDYFKLQKEYESKYGERTILLFQVGSFFEVYSSPTKGFNLKELSSILNIQSTRKNKNIPISEENCEMCGFPQHSLKKFLRILLENQFTVIVYVQKEKSGKITRNLEGVYTYGTYLDDSETEESHSNDNNIICLFFDAIDTDTNTYVISASQIDLFSGKGSVLINDSIDPMEQYAVVTRYLQLFKSREIIYAITDVKTDAMAIIDNLDIDLNKTMIQRFAITQQTNIHYQNEVLEKVYGKESIISQIERIGLERYPNLVTSWITLIDYVYEHNPNILKNIDYPSIINNGDNLLLENNAIEQLNLISNNSLEITNKRYQSVYHVVNNCVTAIGKRYLKMQLLQPLTNHKQIQDRYSATEFLMSQERQLTKILDGTLDIEKFNRRLSLDSITPFEFKNLYLTYKKLEELKVFNWDTEFLQDVPDFSIINLWEKHFNFDTFDDEKYFYKGIYPELDKIQELIDKEQEGIQKHHKYLNNVLNKQEKKEINGVKLEFNDKDSHYFSTTTRRAKIIEQQLTTEDKKNFIFKPMPKSQTMKIFLNVQMDKSILINYRELTKRCWTESCIKMYNTSRDSLKHIVDWVSRIDFILSNIKTSQMYKYTKPKIVQSDKSFVKFTEMRHPIIERLVRDSIPYVAHNISLGQEQDGILLYGLNSAGKSSIMKAIGINIILAQCGMYVPCKDMEYSPYTSLFTRITGNDNIFKGLSSFSLEMVELNNIIKYATKSSLVIGDEICRGTETISACSIVSTILIMLAQRKCSFIFASHLHDLVQIKDITDLKNMSVYHLKISIDEKNEKLIYDRQLEKGSGENIYGVTVAKFVIKDTEFIRLTDKMVEIHKQLYNQGHTNGNKIKLKIVGSKKSRYNSKKFISECEKCGKKPSYKGELETHHDFIHQEECDSSGHKDHLHKNSKWNLKVLCDSCHEKEHI